MKNNVIGKGSKYRNLASDIIVFIIGNVFAKAIQFLLMPLYTTYMTTESYGIAEMTNNLSEFFFPIATLCIHEAAFRFAVDPEFDNNKIVSSVIKVMSTSTIIGILITVVARSVFHYKYAFYLFFVLYSFSIRMCAAFFVRGKGLSKIFALSGVVNAISLSIFNILFIVVIGTSEAGYLISIGLSYCCSAIYLVIKGGIFDNYRSKKYNNGDISILFKYCIPLIFYNILYWFTTISGRYILLWFSDSSTAGKYVAATKIASVINMIQQAVYSAFQLNTSGAYTEEGKEEYYADITNLLVAIYSIFGAVIICLAPFLAKFTLKNDFYEANVYLPIIMLAALINCISTVFGAMYSAYKKTQRVVVVSLIGATINVVFGIVLTPLFGVWGVCIASVLCYLTQTIYRCFDVKGFSNIHYNWIIIGIDILLLLIQVLLVSINPYSGFYYAFGIVILLTFINHNTLFSALKMIVKK